MARDPRRGPPGPSPLDDTALLKALSWMGYFSLRPWLTTAIGVAVVVLVLVPFAIVNPIPYFGMPGALAAGVAIAAAIAAGPRAGLGVAAVGSVFFIFFVADPAHDFAGVATYATVAIWMAAAYVAGFMADHLRSRLDRLFVEIETRDEQIRGTLEAASTAVGLFTGPELRCRNANARLRSLFVREDWADRPLIELIPGLSPSLAGELQACVVGDEEAVQASEVFVPTARRSFSVSARCSIEAPEPTLFVTMIDVTSSLEVRRALERLLALTQELHVSLTPHRVADAACRIAVEMFGCETASFWNIEGEQVDIVARIPGPPPVGAWRLEEIGDLRRLVDAREPMFIHDVQEHFSGDGSQARLEAYFRNQGYHSLLGLPISYGDAVGALLFLAWHDRVDHPTDELLIVARRFADEAAIAVERARSLQEQQQRLAAEEETTRLLRQLEERLQPRLQLRNPDLRVEYVYRPSEEGMLIGGDFVGAIETPDGSLAVVIGDISGHGPESAALGATLRASWRAMAMAGLQPAELMAHLEQVLVRDRRDDVEFATVCCAWLDVVRSRLTVVLAGHHRPLLLDGGVRELDVPYGPALGMFEAEHWQPVELALPKEWGLLLYTDGLVEGRVSAHSVERLGLERVTALLVKDGPTHEIDHDRLVGLVEEVRNANGSPLADDVAMLFVAPRHLSGGREAERQDEAAAPQEGGGARLRGERGAQPSGPARVTGR